MNILNRTLITQSKDVFRVLWVQDQNSCIIALDGKTMPVFVPTEDILNRCLYTPDPFNGLETNIPVEYAQMRDNAWEEMRPLLTAEPYIYYRNPRAEMVHSLEHLSGRSKKYIYSHMKRYWIMGKNINAFIPNYANCGKSKKVHHCGRKRVDGSTPPMITSEMLQALLPIFKMLQSNGYRNIKEAYQDAITVLAKYDQEDKISYGQFNRRYQKFCAHDYFDVVL